MKHLRVLLFLPILILSSFKPANDEYFIGKITYECNYVGIPDDFGIDALKSMFGCKEYYYINATNYKSYFEADEVKSLYNSPLNHKWDRMMPGHAMDKFKVTESCDRDTIIANDKTETILGYACKSVTKKYEGQTEIIYYSPLIKVSPEPFKNNGCFYKLLLATGGALPLKTVSIIQDYSIEFTAVSIEKMDLTDSDFNEKSLIKN